MEKIKDNLSHIDPNTMILIGEKIIRQHTALGTLSPLSGVLVADLNSRISNARLKHEEGLKFQRLMEAAWHDRDYYLGGKEKNVRYTLMAINNILKGENQNTDEWGFEHLKEI
jgi:hypothetical protein